MRRPSSRLTGWLPVLVLACVGVAGCSLLPQSGPVVLRQGTGEVTPSEPPYVDPPGPGRGADPEEIVRGFLQAMQANPVSTATARTFLSEQARQVWKPDAGTLVYDALTVTRHGDTVAARLSDTHRLDARGSWSPRPTRTETIRFRLVREHRQWRIDDPGSVLMVRSGYFADQFLPYSLYFFDHTGRVLVPQPVYVPRGDQTATSLVRGLLAGPEGRLSQVVRSEFPTSVGLDPSVVVTDSGVAEVPLGPEVLTLSPDELSRAMVQLAWTLRPVPGVNRVRITVGGTPLTMPDGRTDLGVDEGEEFAPSGLGATRELVAVQAGRVVTVSGGTVERVAGALGRRGFALRSVAIDRSGGMVAAVSEDGTTMYTAATEPGSGRVARAVEGGRDLIGPAYDAFGNLWVVDRTAAGAVVHVVADGRDRVVRVPGVSGRSVTSFAVSPDGTEVAAGVADRIRPRVTVVAVLRGAAGRVLGGTAPEAVPVASYDPLHELGPVVDVGWRTPTLLAVLTRPTAASSRVVYAMPDGSPGLDLPPLPDTLPEAGTSLVVNADGALPLMVLDARGRLARLDGAGKWEDTSVRRLSAAAYTH